jgi:hypothetical protein
MWIDYDIGRGAPIQPRTQDELCGFMRCSPNPANPGAKAGKIVEAVAQFTYSGWPTDAHGLNAGGPGIAPKPIAQGELELLQAEQISSIDDAIPMLVSVRSGRHLVVLEGGNWHRGASYRVWDTVVYHDPDRFHGGPGREVDPARWALLTCPLGSLDTCFQIFQKFAVRNALLNLNSYGEDVRLRGVSKWTGPQQPQ